MAAELCLPVGDRRWGNAEEVGRVLGREGQQALDAQDTEALAGRVVRPVLGQDLVPALAKDACDLLEQADEDGVLLDLADGLEERIVRGAQVLDALGKGEAQEMDGFVEGADSQRFKGAPCRSRR